MNNNYIRSKSAIRYLGVTIDEKLNFKSHVANVCGKVRQTSLRMRAIVGATWGIKGRQLARVYEGAIEPALLYAAPIWFTKCGVKEKKKLLSEQRVLLKLAARALKTASTEAILVITGVTPVDIKASQITTAREIHKLRRIPLESMGATPEDMDKLAISELLKIHPADIITTEVTIAEEIKDDTCIYTDGSKSEAGVGAAFTVRKGQTEITHKKFKLADHCTVFQAEMLAIRKAAQYVADNREIFQGKCTIHTNSRASALALRDLNKPTDSILDTYKDIQRARPYTTIKLNWIKAHRGEEGNERADELAKQAAEMVTRAEYSKIPIGALRRKAKDEAQRKWQTSWENGIVGRRTHDIAEWHKHNVVLNRGAVQLVTGHGNFGAYLYKIGKLDAPACECGALYDSPDHKMFECPREDRWRGISQRTAVARGIQWPETAEQLKAAVKKRDW